MRPLILLTFLAELGKLGQGGTQTIKRGSMNRPDGRCNTISILRDANYSIGIHELAHDWLVRFLTDSEHELATGFGMTFVEGFLDPRYNEVGTTIKLPNF